MTEATTRYETCIWEPKDFYEVEFGKPVIDEYLGMPKDFDHANKLMRDYDQIIRDMNRPARDYPFQPAPGSYAKELLEEVKVGRIRRLPHGTVPLYEYAHFQKEIGQPVVSSLGAVGIYRAQADYRGDRYVLAPLTDGRLEIDKGTALAGPAPYFRPAAQYMLRRVGYCMPVLSTDLRDEVRHEQVAESATEAFGRVERGEISGFHVMRDGSYQAFPTEEA